MEVTEGIRADRPIDLETIAQRVVALAEMSATEHLHAISRSQAQGLLQLAREASGTHTRAPGGRWR